MRPEATIAIVGLSISSAILGLYYWVLFDALTSLFDARTSLVDALTSLPQPAAAAAVVCCAYSYQH